MLGLYRNLNPSLEIPAMRHQPQRQSHPVLATIWRHHTPESGSLGADLTRAGVGPQDSHSPPQPSAFLLRPNFFGGLEGGAAATEPVFTLTRMVTSFLEVRGPCGEAHRAEPHISMGCPRTLGWFFCFVFFLILILLVRLSVQRVKGTLPGAEVLRLEDAVSGKSYGCGKRRWTLGVLRRHRQEWPLFKVGVPSRSARARVGSGWANE